MNKKNKFEMNDLLSLEEGCFTFLNDKEKEQTFQSFTSNQEYEDLLGHLILLSLPTPSQHIH
jgi:hypothetical protein